MTAICFDVLLAVTTVVIIVISRKVLPILTVKFTKGQLEQMKFWADLAVGAAEQIWTHTQGAGESKKSFVLNFLNSRVKAEGFRLSEEQLDILVEHAVKELKNHNK